MEEHEKRIHPRKPTQYPIQMVFQGQDFQGTLLNISREGAFLKIEDRGNLPVGHIHSEVHLKEPEDRILAGFQAKGTLVRAFAGEDGGFYCAVRFLDVVAEDHLEILAHPATETC